MKVLQEKCIYSASCNICIKTLLQMNKNNDTDQNKKMKFRTLGNNEIHSKSSNEGCPGNVKFPKDKSRKSSKLFSVLTGCTLFMTLLG